MIETLDEKKEFYTRQCLILFLKNGIKNLTIGDITKELNVSSKTLYKIYGDKIGLVEECIDLYQKNTEIKYNDFFVNDQKMSVDVYLSAYFLVVYSMGKMNPLFLNDLTRYFRTEEKLNSILGKPLIFDLLVRAKKDGYIKKELDLNVIIEALLVLFKSFLVKGDRLVTREENISFFVNVLWPFSEGLATDESVDLLKEKRGLFVEMFQE